MTKLDDVARNWEAFAQKDPLWAVCSDPARKGSRWDPEGFFESGRQEITTVLEYLQRLGVAPNLTRPVLDFGCGVGRLTQALAEHFEQCIGVDISPTMVHVANRFNRFPDRCRYVLNTSSSLSGFQDAHFGFIYTSIVLQHLRAPLALAYIREFARVLTADGVLVFQLPERSKDSFAKRLRNRLRLRSRGLQLLARLRLASYEPFMEVNHVAEAKVRSVISDLGLHLVDVQLTNSTDKNFNGQLKFLERERDRGDVSKQYCVMKQRR